LVGDNDGNIGVLPEDFNALFAATRREDLIGVAEKLCKEKQQM
jgi:hypothetical protein